MINHSLKLYFAILLIFMAFASCNNTIDKIYQIEDMPYYPEYSGDPIFWEMVKEGLKVVPDLLEKIGDTTKTNITVPNFGGYYSIGDISYMVLSKIIKGIPIYEFLNISKEKVDQIGFNAYWNYVRANPENRRNLQIKIKEWYLKNKNDLVWIKDEHEYKGGSNNYPRKHPAGGYYILKEK